MRNHRVIIRNVVEGTPLPAIRGSVLAQAKRPSSPWIVRFWRYAPPASQAPSPGGYPGGAMLPAMNGTTCKKKFKKQKMRG